MADKRLWDRIYIRDGNVLHVEECAGEYREFPFDCGCSDGETPNDPSFPDNICDMANGFAFAFDTAIQNVWYRVASMADTAVTWALGAAYWARGKTDYTTSFAKMYGFLSRSLTAFQDTPFRVETPTPAIHPVLGQELVCIAAAALEANEAKFNQGWFDYVLNLLNQHEDLTPFSANQWQLIGQFIEACGLDWWKEESIYLGLDLAGWTSFECTGCGTVTGSCEDANFARITYAWNSPFWTDNNVKICYLNGQYTSCEPYNARRGVVHTLEFQEPFCLTTVGFAFAGNGAATTHSAEIYVNDILVDSPTQLAQFLACRFGQEVIWSAPEPIPNVVKVEIRFVNLTGPQPEAGVDLHCIKIGRSV
jgi:hypothetical protein